jgi:hypothetical protein
LQLAAPGSWIRPSKQAPTQGGRMAAKFVLKNAPNVEVDDQTAK